MVKLVPFVSSVVIALTVSSGLLQASDLDPLVINRYGETVPLDDQSLSTIETYGDSTVYRTRHRPRVNSGYSSGDPATDAFTGALLGNVIGGIVSDQIGNRVQNNPQFKKWFPKDPLAPAPGPGPAPVADQ